MYFGKVTVLTVVMQRDKRSWPSDRATLGQASFRASLTVNMVTRSRPASGTPIIEFSYGCYVVTLVILSTKFGLAKRFKKYGKL